MPLLTQFMHMAITSGRSATNTACQPWENCHSLAAGPSHDTVPLRTLRCYFPTLMLMKRLAHVETLLKRASGTRVKSLQAPSTRLKSISQSHYLNQRYRAFLPPFAPQELTVAGKDGFGYVARCEARSRSQNSTRLPGEG